MWQHLSAHGSIYGRRRRIFAKSAGVAKKSRDVTGSHPIYVPPFQGFGVQLLKRFFLGKQI